ncbi:unnamed protein product [Chironomus riparius]|uniref:Uncharacterized protein n=1 Tax=Chironomus riparius TaxID=315576 RepID=A0A9N9S1W6_9DIPT|nr:unnamed protein product [Chironomus riparius]
MRFITVLVLFAVIAYASSNSVSQIVTEDLPAQELLNDSPTAVAYNLGNSKAACTLSWCVNYCSSRMSPPFRSTCCGDYCICEKL